MKRCKMLALLFSVFAMFSAAGADIVVENGILAPGNLLLGPSDWVFRDDALWCSGTNKFMLTGRLYAGDEFTVDADIALTRFGGTAASFVMGSGNFGIDGGEITPCFFESRELPKGYISFTPSWRYNPGEFFHFQAVAKDGKLRFYGNGNLLAETDNILSDELISFGFRPHRNQIAVKNLRINGKFVKFDIVAAENMCSQRSTTPVVSGLFAFGKDADMMLKYSGNLPVGKHEFKLEGIAFTSEIKEGGLIRIPGNVLREAYAKSTQTRNIRTLKLEIDEQRVCIVCVYDPGAANEYPLCEVRNDAGFPQGYINGKPMGTITARMARAFGPQFYGSAVKQFAEAGVHNNLMITEAFELMDPETYKLDPARLETYCREFMNRTIAEDPEAEFTLFWNLRVPSSFVERYPDELLKLDTGGTLLHTGVDMKLQPSYASEVWRKIAGEALREALEYLRKTPYAERISRIRVCYASCGEWNHWGYGEKAFVDFAPPMNREFGKWLKKRYGTVEALRKAWGRNDVTFESADLVPDREARFSGGNTFRLNGTEGQSTVDYYTFFQEFAVDTILYYAKIACEATDHRPLVGSYYGYYWGHLNAVPLHMQDSGNFAMGRILRSPYIDFVGGPYPYEFRRNDLYLNGITGSVALHGKVWESEGDMRTHLSDKSHVVFGKTDNLAESIELAKRDFMVNRTGKASYYFFDFVNDWYRDTDFMATVKKLHDIDFATHGMADRYPAQIAIIVSEETLPYIANNTEDIRALMDERLFIRNHSRIGAPMDIYLESDLDKINFNKYKVVIMFNTFYASDRTINLVHKRVMKNGRVVIFFYAPGMIGKNNTLDLARAERLTGIRMNADPAQSHQEIRWLPGKYIMKSGRPVPFLTWIEDPNVEVIADYPDSGKVAAGIKKLPGCTSVVICAPGPTVIHTRALLGRFGIHLYQTKSTECVYYSGPIISMFSRTGGQRELALPKPAEIVADLFTGEIIGRNIKVIKFTMPQNTPTTRMFFAGSEKDYQAVLNALK